MNRDNIVKNFYVKDVRTKTPIEDSLIFWLDSKDFGTTWKDRVLGQEGAVITAEKAGDFVSFNGVDSVIRFTDMSQFTFTNKITLCTWAKLNTSHNGSLIMCNELAAERLDIRFFTNTANNFNFSTQTGPFNPLFGKLPIANYIGKWVFVCGVYNGSQMRLYVNDTLDGVRSATNNVNIDVPEMDIGGDFTNGGPSLDGLISSVVMYNRDLSANEILHNYHILRPF